MKTFLFHIFGLVSSMKFHKIVYIAEKIREKYCRRIKGIITDPLLESEWQEFIAVQKKKIGGEVYAFEDVVMVFVDNRYLGGCEEFFEWLKTKIKGGFIPQIPDTFISEAHQRLQHHLRARKHIFTFFDITNGLNPSARLIFELYQDVVPKTCENFRALCTGEKGKSKNGVTLNYANSIIHRVVPQGWIQGGDIVSNRGNSGESIYGSIFDDENFIVSHNRRGVLGMANHGRNTNSSQFYVTLAPAEWMDTKLVAFGQLVYGCQLLREIEVAKTNNKRPVLQICIIQSGIMPITQFRLTHLTREDVAIYIPIHLSPPDVPLKIIRPREKRRNSQAMILCQIQNAEDRTFDLLMIPDDEILDDDDTDSNYDLSDSLSFRSIIAKYPELLRKFHSD